MLDYGLFPPEVNSVRMYAGPGSQPLLDAATAWQNLASQLSETATGYHSVISGLTTGIWHGTAAASMTAAAHLMQTWMTGTAGQVEQTAAQARAASAAYEAAHAATVPPAVIAANRTLLASLVATNALGQNTPAIAAAEAHYAEMWAQDSAAMYGYASSSMAAAQLTPFTAPPQNTNPAGQAQQAAAVTQATATSTGANLQQLLSAIPSALQQLASPASGTSVFSPGSLTATTGLAGFLNMIDGNSAFGGFLNNNLWNTVFSSGFYMPGNYLGNMTSFLALGHVSHALGAAAASGHGQSVLPMPDLGPLENFGGLGAMPSAGLGQIPPGVSAGVGQATALGPLSVPPSWTAVAPPTVPAGATLTAAPFHGASAAGAPGAPGMPLGGGTAQRGLMALPKYGYRPNVVPRPPAAG